MRRLTLLPAIVVLCAPPIGARAAERATVSAALNMSALQPGQQAAIAVVLDVKPGYHSQSHTPKGEGMIATEVVMSDAPPITTFAPIYPLGKDENYPNLGQLNVYSGETIIYVPLQVAAQASPASVK